MQLVTTDALGAYGSIRLLQDTRDYKIRYVAILLKDAKRYRQCQGVKIMVTNVKKWLTGSQSRGLP